MTGAVSLSDIVKKETERISSVVETIEECIGSVRKYIGKEDVSEEDFKNAGIDLGRALHLASTNPHLEKYFRDGIVELEEVRREYWNAYVPFVLSGIRKEADERPLSPITTIDLVESYHRVLYDAKENGLNLDIDALNKKFYPKFGRRYLEEVENMISSGKGFDVSSNAENALFYLVRAKKCFDKVGLSDEEFSKRWESAKYKVLIYKAELVIRGIETSIRSYLNSSGANIGKDVSKGFFEAESILGYLKKTNPNGPELKELDGKLSELSAQAREKYISDLLLEK